MSDVTSIRFIGYHWIGTYTQIQPFFCLVELGFSRNSPQNQSKCPYDFPFKTKRTPRFFHHFLSASGKTYKVFLSQVWNSPVCQNSCKRNKIMLLFQEFFKFQCNKNTHAHTLPYFKEFLEQELLGSLDSMDEFLKIPAIFRSKCS